MTATNQHVPPEINPGARLMIVAEAPGETEVAQGRPLVGKSGDLLFNALRRVKLQRDQFVITNVCQYRPPANDITKATAEQLEEGKAALFALIEEVKPLAILALGNTAMMALLGKDSISNRRGSVYDYNGIPVVVTLHPAAVLRSSKDTVLFVHDITRFSKVVDGTHEPNPERRLVINPTAADLEELDRALERGIPCAVDIEADGRNLSCVGFAPRRDYAVCVPADTPERRAFIRRMLGRDLRWVFHNSPYDVPFLTHRCGYHIGGVIEDTLSQHQALHPEMPRDLATLTSMYTSQPYYKDMYESEDLDEFYRYNALDVSVTIEIFGVLERKLQAWGLYDVYARKRDVLPHAHAMSALGLRYDTERAKEVGAAIDKEIAALQAELNEMVGREINVFSPKQVPELLFKEMRLAGRRDRKTGKISSGQAHLLDLYSKVPDERVRRILKLILMLRHKRKFKSSYLKVRLSPDGRCRTSYGPSGTETGRWSASKFLITEGANLQTIPPQWKQCFIADEGMVLWMADYSQIEARFVAWLANDREQIEMFKRGGDIHKLNASRIFVKPIEEITKDERQIGKASHALNYGVGPNTLRDFVNKRALETDFWMSLDMAKRMRSAYLDRFKAIVRWQKATWDQVRKTRTLTNPFGRKRIFLGGISSASDDAEHTKKEALAFVPQSTVPDMLDMAIIKLRTNPPCEGFEVAMQVHDAIGGWGPADKIAVWAPAIKQAMDIPVPFEAGECRVPVDLGIGPRLSELKEWKPDPAPQT